MCRKCTRLWVIFPAVLCLLWLCTTVVECILQVVTLLLFVVQWWQCWNRWWNLHGGTLQRLSSTSTKEWSELVFSCSFVIISSNYLSVCWRGWPKIHRRGWDWGESFEWWPASLSVFWQWGRRPHHSMHYIIHPPVIQWNLWTRDTMGPTILSLVESNPYRRGQIIYVLAWGWNKCPL